MAEENKIILDEVFKRLDEFEKTVNELQQNLKSFRKRLEENREKYGPDITKWPKAKE